MPCSGLKALLTCGARESKAICNSLQCIRCSPRTHFHGKSLQPYLQQWKIYLYCYLKALLRLIRAWFVCFYPCLHWLRTFVCCLECVQTGPLFLLGKVSHIIWSYFFAFELKLVMFHSMRGQAQKHKAHTKKNDREFLNRRNLWLTELYSAMASYKFYLFLQSRVVWMVDFNLIIYVDKIEQEDRLCCVVPTAVFDSSLQCLICCKIKVEVRKQILLNLRLICQRDLDEWSNGQLGLDLQESL